MERDEEHRVVAAKDRLRAVAVVHVVVDDRDPREPELRLRVARRDRHVVEHAEAHRAVGEGVVAGRADQREAAAIDCLQGDPGREHGGLPGRLGRDRVVVEEQRQLDRLQEREVIGRVHASQLLVRRPPLDRLAVQPEQPRPAAPGALPSGAGAPELDWSGARQCLQASGEPAETPFVRERGGAGPRRAPGRPAAARAPRRPSSRCGGRAAAPRPLPRTGPPRAPRRGCRTAPAATAAVLAPTPRAPGILSDGSPRSAMKSGTCVGSTP